MAESNTRRSSLSEIRSEFPVTQNLAYLDVAGRAPMANRVADRLRDYIDECQLHGAHKQTWLKRAERVRERIAVLIGASSTEVAFSKNTSEGLNTLASSLGLRSGDNIVVCPDLEHPNNVYAWTYRRDQGIEVRFVPSVDSRFDVDAFASRIDERTRLVSVSSVSFLSGARADLTSLARHCDAVGAFLLVDAVQSLGVIRTYVHQLGVGGVVAATQKGLLGTYGLGILYCSSAWLSRLRPPVLSRAGVSNGYAHESEIGDIENYELSPTAKRFEVGNHNFGGIFALEAALEILEEVSVGVIEDHVAALGALAIDGLEALGLVVTTPRDRLKRAHIVTFRHMESVRVADALAEVGVKVAARRDGVRASFHVYNDESDVERFLSALDGLTPR